MNNDNGTLITRTGRLDDWKELLGQDGGWMVIDPGDPGHILASSQFGNMERFRDTSSGSVTPPFKQEDMAGVWMVYITLDPNDANVASSSTFQPESGWRKTTARI